jgi:hypothetical protein
MNVYSTQWKPHGPEAQKAIEQLAEHLDGRKKSLQDDERNRRILSGFLAVREGPFDVYTTKVPKEDQAAVRDAVEALTGPVLKRVSGKHTYEFDNSVLPYHTRVETITGTNRQKLETRWGAIYHDNSFDGLPFEAFGRFGYAKPQLVEIIAPHHHWRIFHGECEAPSRFWHELDEVDDKHPRHDELMDFILERAALRGVHVVRYGDNAFICGHHQQFIRQLDTNIARYTNTSGQRPLLLVTDEYGRKIPRPGSATARCLGSSS